MRTPYPALHSARTPAWIIAIAMILLLPSAFASTPADQLLVGMNMNNVLTLDPASATGNDVVPIAANLYDTLVELDPSEVTKITPAVADRWTISPDRRRITFFLHQGIVFQSGRALTADDVAWSLQRTVILNRALASPWKSYGFSAKNVGELIRAVDANTLTIDLPIVLDPKMILYTLGTSIGAVVLDKDAVMAHAQATGQADKQVNGQANKQIDTLANKPATDLGAAWLTTHAAGSGPFTLAVWRPEDVMLLDRNPHYWRGPATMRRLVFRHIPESQALRLMLERNDLDVAIGLSAPDIQALRRQAGVQVKSVSTGSVYYVALSMKAPHFADKRVREAIRSLIDYAGINRSVMPNYGVPHQRPVQSGLAGSLPDPGYILNVAHAKTLLADAGYPHGFETTIRVLSDPPYLNIATSLQSTLQLAGISAQVLTGTGNQIYGAMRDRKFDIVVGRGGGGLEPDPYSNLRALVYNPNNADAAKLTNFQGWRTGFFDPEINRLFVLAQQSPDSHEQAMLYQQAQRRYADDVGPIFPISQVTSTVVIGKDVHDYQLSPVWTTRVRDVSKQASRN